MSEQMSKREGAFCGLFVGWILGFIACILCAVKGFIFELHTPAYALLIYGAVLGSPLAIVGYFYPRTFNWILTLISFLPLP